MAQKNRQANRMELRTQKIQKVLTMSDQEFGHWFLGVLFSINEDLEERKKEDKIIEKLFPSKKLEKALKRIVLDEVSKEHQTALEKKHDRFVVSKIIKVGEATKKLNYRIQQHLKILLSYAETNHFGLWG